MQKWVVFNRQSQSNLRGNWHTTSTSSTEQLKLGLSPPKMKSRPSGRLFAAESVLGSFFYNTEVQVPQDLMGAYCTPDKY